MAAPFTVQLPAVGAKPWNLNPSIVELRTRIGNTDDVINTGRLSESNISSTVTDAIESEKGTLDGLARTTALDLRNFITTSTPTSDYSTALSAMANAAADAGVYALVPSGFWPGELSIADKSLRLICEGTIVQLPNKGVIRWSNTPGTRRPISGVGTIDIVSQATANDQMPAGERINTVVFPDGVDISDISYGDQYWIESDDRYPGSFTEGSTSKTYQRRWFQVAGIALNCSPTGGGFLPDTTIIGSISGATAYVRSVSNRFGGSKTLKLHSMTGMFQVGESLTVNGVTVGSVSYRPYVLTRDPWGFISSWSTNVCVRKIDTTKKVDIQNLRFTTQTSFDDPAANKDAVVIRGAFDPVITVHIDSAYSRGISFESCRGGSARGTGGFLGNNTTLGKYGYFFQVTGCTQDMDIDGVEIHDCRHPFTTNTFPQYNPASSDPEFNTLGIPTAGDKVFRSGVPRSNNVKVSAYNCLGAALDTHAGAEETRFYDCYVRNGGSAGEIATRSAGINNRAFGTIFENCTIDGFTWGAQDSTYKIDTGGPTRIRYSNVKFRNILESCFRHGSDTNGGDTSRGRVTYLLEDCTFGMIQMPFGGAVTQTAVDLSVSATTIIRPTFLGSNFAHVNLRNNVYDLSIIDPIVNLLDQPAATIQLTVTMSGQGVSSGDSVTGATSGATALVTSVSGSTVYATPTNTVNFQNAENISVGGTVVGTTSAAPIYPAGYFLRFSGTVSNSRRAVTSNVKILDNSTGNSLRFVYYVNGGQTGNIRRDTITVIRPGGSGPALSGGGGTFTSATNSTL